MFIGNLNRALRIILDEGVGSLFKKCISKLIRIDKLVIFELNLMEPIREVRATINLAFKFASQEDIEEFDEILFDYTQEAKKYSLERLKKGDKCFLAMHDEKTIGYFWLMYDEMEVSVNKHYIDLPKSKAFNYKGFVLNEFRGKRIFNAMDHEIIMELKRAGKKYLLTIVSMKNKPSLKARERMKFMEIGRIIRINILNYEYNYIKKEYLMHIIN